MALPHAAKNMMKAHCQLQAGRCLADHSGPHRCSASGGLCDRCLPFFVGGRYNAAVQREGCACLCHRLGYTIAGVENGNNCFCANATSPKTFCGGASAAACTVPCNGNRSQICGGSMAVYVYSFQCSSDCIALPAGPSPAPGPPRPSPTKKYPFLPRIHWAQGCLEGRVTHDISGGIIQQSDGTFHVWIGCFNAQPGGGWQHIVSRDLLSWAIASPFTATALPPFTQKRHIEAGAVGIDETGRAFAVEGYPGKNKVGPYNAYRFTNSSNNAWMEPSQLFSFISERGLPGDPPRPWRDPRDGRWYALLSFNGCNESMVHHPEWTSDCPRGGEAKMWTSPQLFGPAAQWIQTASLLIDNRTVLDGHNVPNRPSTTEFVTSDFFPVQNHTLVNAVFITSRYGKGSPDKMIPKEKPDPDGSGFWNYLMAYVGVQHAPGKPMRVLHRVCLDWGSFVRTEGYHGIDAATDAGTTYGIGTQ
jgi:hypothetical protein